MNAEMEVKSAQQRKSEMEKYVYLENFACIGLFLYIFYILDGVENALESLRRVKVSPEIF